MRGLLIFTSLVLIVAVCGAVFPVRGEVGLYDRMIRLHVIANSDSPEDQELKLAVRDAVLEASRGILSGADGVQDAREALEGSVPVLLDVCRRVISERGYGYDVTIGTGYEQYPEKSYDGFTLPSGDYYSVRVLIGGAAGKNWWCVLFPPLCLGAAKGREDGAAVMASAGLSREQVNIMTENGDGGYVLKFRIVEFFRRVFSAK